jgi:hypothetical protein
MPEIDPVAEGLENFIARIYVDFHVPEDPASPTIYGHIVDAMVRRIVNHHAGPGVPHDIFDDEYKDVQKAWRNIQVHWPHGHLVEIKGFMGQEWSDEADGKVGKLMEKFGTAIAQIFERAYSDMMDEATRDNPNWREEQMEEELLRRARRERAQKFPENAWELPDDDPVYQFLFN